jgi:hypothetical protein
MLATAIPKHKIVEVTLSPLARGIHVQSGQPPEYIEGEHRPANPANVLASVVYGSGVLHTDAQLGFTVRSGRIISVTLYRRWMAPLQHLDSMAKLHAAFGIPQRCLWLQADGDELGYDSYYEKSRKWVRWLTSARRPTFVMYGGNAVSIRVGDRGGVMRRPAPARWT